MRVCAMALCVGAAGTCLCGVPAARGHKVTRIGHIGLVNAIGIDPKTGARLGAADPRDEGSAEGY